jgi:hypothetical protein
MNQDLLAYGFGIGSFFNELEIANPKMLEYGFGELA